MTPKTEAKKAPKHLRAATRKWWEAVANGFEPLDHHFHVLTLAAESWDRHLEARETLAKSGTTYINRFGEPKAHPAVEIEATNRLHFARMLRELCLDVEEPSDSRLPRNGRDD